MLSVDSIFMMPHLGVLSTINEQAATDVFVRRITSYNVCYTKLLRKEAGALMRQANAEAKGILALYTPLTSTSV